MDKYTYPHPIRSSWSINWLTSPIIMCEPSVKRALNPRRKKSSKTERNQKQQKEWINWPWMNTFYKSRSLPDRVRKHLEKRKRNRAIRKTLNANVWMFFIDMRANERNLPHRRCMCWQSLELHCMLWGFFPICMVSDWPCIVVPMIIWNIDKHPILWDQARAMKSTANDWYVDLYKEKKVSNVKGQFINSCIVRITGVLRRILHTYTRTQIECVQTCEVLFDKIQRQYVHWSKLRMIKHQIKN